MSCFTTLAQRIRAFEASSIYPVISSEFCQNRDPLEILKELLAGGAKVVQMREKHLSDKGYLCLLKAARKITDSAQALLIVDDRVDLALAADADGVHLGQDDMPLAEAAKIAPELLLGTSTHNKEEVLQAQLDNCGYLNIGPIFPTGTKELAIPALGIETLKELIPLVRCPFSVMGGIKTEHLQLLKKLSVKHIAAVTAFTAAPSPRQAAENWINILKEE